MNSLLSLFHWILDASLRASCLAIVVLILQAAFGRVLSARWRYLLWLPVLLVLMAPVLPHSRWSVENLWIARARPAAPMPVASLPAEVTDQNVPVSTDTAELPAEDATSSRDRWLEIAATVWAAGAILTAVAGLTFYAIALRRFTRGAAQPDDSLAALVHALCVQLHISHPPLVILSSSVESPAVTGLLRPVLLLPAGFAETFSGQEARLVLKHELMHMKRRDLQVNALTSLLNALHWFNPILWLATSCSRQHREAACDAQVLASEAGDPRSDYGSALLKVESILCTRRLSIGFVGIFQPGRAIRSRIEAVARYHRPSPAGAFLAGAMIILTALLGATHAQTDSAVDSGSPAAAASPAAAVAQTTLSSVVSYDNEATAKKVHAMNDKLERIIIPKLDFHNATVREAITFLNHRSVELDTKEIDPAKRGVKIILQTWDDGATSSGPSPAKDPFFASVTLSLTNIPLMEAIRYVADLGGLRVRVGPDGVHVLSQNVRETMFTKEYKIQPNFEMPAGKTKGTFQTAMEYLTSEGLTFPPGATASYFPATHRLVVFNTAENLELLDAIVIEGVDSLDALGAPSNPLPLKSQATEPRHHTTDDMIAKINQIILPKVDFHDVSVQQAVEFFKQKSRELDTQETDPSRRGVNIVLPFDVTPSESAPPVNVTNARITLSLSNIPLVTALGYVAQLAGLKVKIDPFAVELLPPNLNANVLITREYETPPGFLRMPVNAPRQGSMDYLTANGVTFPAGANAAYFPATHRLIARNTEQNLELIDAIVESWASPPTSGSSPSGSPTSRLPVPPPPMPPKIPGLQASPPTPKSAMSPVASSPKSAGTVDIRHNDYITEKLNRIVIPKIELHDVFPREAVDFLKEKGREFDTQESDATRRGVNILLQLESPEAGSDSSASSPRISLSVSNIPLSVAIQNVAGQAGLKVDIDPYAVLLVPPGSDIEHIITKEYKTPTDFMAYPGKITSPQETAREYLSANGVAFPAGADAIYFPATNRLIVHNTGANIALVDRLVDPEIPEAQVITVTDQGKYRFNSEHATLPELKQKLTELATTSPTPRLLIRGDSVKQYQSMMDALTVAKDAGFTKVTFDTKPAR